MADSEEQLQTGPRAAGLAASSLSERCLMGSCLKYHARKSGVGDSWPEQVGYKILLTYLLAAGARN